MRKRWRERCGGRNECRWRRRRKRGEDKNVERERKEGKKKCWKKRKYYREEGNWYCCGGGGKDETAGKKQIKNELDLKQKEKYEEQEGVKGNNTVTGKMHWEKKQRW